MKKILLIDDEIGKQNSLLKQYEIDLTDNAEILDNLTGEDATNFLVDFNIDDKLLLQYKVWIIHQTIFNEIKSIQKKVEKFCRQNSIKLVLFTGITSTVMFKPKKGLLKLSRNNLYKNLKLFLEESLDNESQLEILGFGSKWEVTLLSNVEDSIESFLLEPVQSIGVELFKSKINNLDSAIKILGNEDFYELTGSVDREVIGSLLQDIQDKISEQMEIS